MEAQTVSRPGYLAGFETLEAEVDLDSLPVEGTIPEWLTGTLLRNGPAKFEVGERPLRHWFDGLAMLHRFSFAGGRVSYANRFLRTDAYRAAERGPHLLQRVRHRPLPLDLQARGDDVPARGLTDNCNVNLARLGDEYIAMTETPLPVAFDPETLETLGVAYRAARPSTRPPIPTTTPSATS